MSTYQTDASNSSNTTYTLKRKNLVNDLDESNFKNLTLDRLGNPQAHNSRIVDYLKNLELIKRKPLVDHGKKSQLYDEEQNEEKNSNEINSSQEIDRLQGEFFYDASSNELSLKHNILAITQITSSPISVSSSISSQSLSSNSDSKKEKIDNQLLNRSLEKIRRSVSSPKLRTNVRTVKFSMLLILIIRIHQN